jgi:hypothetical protein
MTLKKEHYNADKSIKGSSKNKFSVNERIDIITIFCAKKKSFFAIFTLAIMEERTMGEVLRGKFETKVTLVDVAARLEEMNVDIIEEIYDALIHVKLDQKAGYLMKLLPYCALRYKDIDPNDKFMRENIASKKTFSEKFGEAKKSIETEYGHKIG